MLGPMKKKMITTGVIAFLIPCVLFAFIFFMYNSRKSSQIAELTRQSRIVYRYVMSGDQPIGHVVSSNDLVLAEVKEISAPSDSFEVLYSGDLMIKNDMARAVGKKLKIAVKDKTILTSAMFLTENDYVSSDLRTKEFNMISLPSDLQVGDYIDIRILFPTGEDYLVVAGKEVKQIGSSSDSNTIFLNLTEEDILRISGAVIESYISDSVNVYAVKYVNPYQQLFSEKNVDYVAKYEDAVAALIQEQSTTEEVTGEPTVTKEPKVDENGENILDESGEIIYEEIVTPGETKTVVKNISVDDLSTKDIATRAGLQESDVEAIRKAVKDGDSSIINMYRNKIEVTETKLVENYPVRPEVATLIASNPNILDTLKAKYNVEKLQAQRANLIDTSLYKPDEYTGEIKEDEEALESIAHSLSEEIETQRTERREYLQSLIRNSMLSQ